MRWSYVLCVLLRFLPPPLILLLLSVGCTMEKTKEETIKEGENHNDQLSLLNLVFCFRLCVRSLDCD